MSSIYDLGIDGTTVWAIYWEFDREIDELKEDKDLFGKVKEFFAEDNEDDDNISAEVVKDKVNFKQLDVLDCYIDPEAESIQEAQSFIYDDVRELAEVKQNAVFHNVEELEGHTSPSNNTVTGNTPGADNFVSDETQREQEVTIIRERWGKVPLSWLTGKESDDGVMVEGVVTLGDVNKDDPVILRVDRNPFEHNKKPFEENWYQKKSNRWYGIGIAEKMLDMQSYLNRTVNRRIENEDVLHSGMFKIKRGSSVSAKDIKSVPGGVIPVEQMDDVQQLKIRDISQLSTGTVNLINNFLAKINGANEAARGSASSESATTSLINDRNASTRFNKVKRYINDFLKRFFEQWMQLNRQFLDKEFVMRVTGEDTNLDRIDEVLDLDEEQKDKSPGMRFINVEPETIRKQYDIQVDIDRSKPLNKSEHANRILRAIELGSSLGLQKNYEKMFDTYLDMIGLRGERFKMAEDKLEKRIKRQEKIKQLREEQQNQDTRNSRQGRPNVPQSGQERGRSGNTAEQLQQFIEANGTRGSGRGRTRQAPQQGQAQQQGGGNLGL